MNLEAYSTVMSYIKHNPMAVVGTINDDGTPHGAIVYVVPVGDRTVYFVTKTLTQKYTNLSKRPIISLTIGNDKESSTLQATGRASLVSDPKMLDMAMRKITQVHAMMVEWLPPLAKLRAGNYAIIKVDITHARLGEFKDSDIGSREIFTEV